MSRSPRRSSTLVATFLLCAASSPLGARAQVNGSTLGWVLDETTGEALEGVTVSMPGANVRVTSVADGTFALPMLPPGRHPVRLELPGYATVVDEIELVPDETRIFRFRLSKVEATLQELIVRVPRRAVQGSSVTEVERGDGHVVTALDMLREQIPGVMVRTTPGSDTGIRIRGSNSLFGNEPSIYLDGIRLSDGGSIVAAHALEQIPAERVRRIRVLHGPSAAARFGDSTSGVILIETR